MRHLIVTGNQTVINTEALPVDTGKWIGKRDGPMDPLCYGNAGYKVDGIWMFITKKFL